MHKTSEPWNHLPVSYTNLGSWNYLPAPYTNFRSWNYLPAPTVCVYSLSLGLGLGIIYLSRVQILVLGINYLPRLYVYILLLQVLVLELSTCPAWTALLSTSTGNGHSLQVCKRDAVQKTLRCVIPDAEIGKDIVRKKGRHSLLWK